MIAIYHLNAGSSGAEARALAEAIETTPELTWADSPAQADVFVVSGAIPLAMRPAFLAVWRDFIAERASLLALGRAAIDGYPFGRGGIGELTEIQVAAKIDGDPPLIAAIQAGITQAMQTRPTRH